MTIIFKKRTETREIILHDSHTTPDLERAVSWVKWQGRKMGLLESGYHFIIDRDGSKTEARPMALIGAACPGYDLHAIHVCLIGGLRAVDLGADGYHAQAEDNFTDAQRETLFGLVRALRGFYGPLPLMGHSEARRHHTTEQGGMCPACDMTDLRNDYTQWRLLHADDEH